MGFVGCVDFFVLAGGVTGFLVGVDLTDGAETEGLADEGFCVWASKGKLIAPKNKTAIAKI